MTQRCKGLDIRSILEAVAELIQKGACMSLANLEQEQTITTEEKTGNVIHLETRLNLAAVAIQDFDVEEENPDIILSID